LLAAIGDIVERHLAGVAGEPVQAEAFAMPAGVRAMPQCPQCGASALVKVEGCNNCLECGYSKCG
jgi:ribonucleoside-diphosphate reductase alpha chain